MNRTTARALSWIFHPAFLPSIFLLLVFNFGPLSSLVFVSKAKWIILSITFVFTCLLPGLTALFLKLSTTIHSMEMRTKEERRIPFLTSAIYYMTAYYLFKELHLPKIFILVMQGATLSIILVMFINIKWKISIHLTGIGCLAGILVGLSPHLSSDLIMPLIFVLICGGFLGAARLSLSAHSPAQVYAGFFCGFLSTFGTLYFLW
jgi:membrane-associated phospholipid phosphatase